MLVSPSDYRVKLQDECFYLSLLDLITSGQVEFLSPVAQLFLDKILKYAADLC